MFIQVKLLNQFHKPLWYKIADNSQKINLIQTIVQVPLRNRITHGLVVHQQENHPEVSFTIRECHQFERFPADTRYMSFIQKLCDYYQIDPISCITRIHYFIALKEKEATNEYPKNHHKSAMANEVTLTPEQQAIVDFINPVIITPRYTPTVIHGVTGSGKTECYKEAIKTAIAHQKTAILLLPEVTLAVNFAQRLTRELGAEFPLYSFHSSVSAPEKRALWADLVAGKPVLIIGVHLPILLPIANLGLIIVDEEHEKGYQEKKHPKINSKEAALIRAKQYNIPIILGSATPSLPTLYNIEHRQWHLFSITKRFAGSFPTVQIELLTDGKERKHFWISTMLHDAIQERLKRKEQTLLFLNRRGFSFFVQCKPCGFIFQCASCSVSLTLHADNMLACHYCGHRQMLPPRCPRCTTSEINFIKKGVGTQQMVSIIKKLLPTARVERADMDATTNKKRWQKTMNDFEKGDIDILVGTQTITKGYDFPRVTLVGIIWADLNLHFPSYNAAETTLQQLIQVAGRAGRHTHESLVVVQAMEQHPIFDYINEVQYPAFYAYEKEIRKEIGYPPFVRLASLELKHTQEHILEREAQELAIALIAHAHQKQTDLRVLGPAKPAVHKIQNTFSRTILLKSSSMATIIAAYQSIGQQYGSHIFFDPNPVN